MTLHPDNPDRMLRDALDRTAERSMTNHTPPEVEEPIREGWRRLPPFTFEDIEDLPRLRRIEKAARDYCERSDRTRFDALRAALEAKP